MMRPVYHLAPDLLHTLPVPSYCVFTVPGVRGLFGVTVDQFVTVTPDTKLASISLGVPVRLCLLRSCW